MYNQKVNCANRSLSPEEQQVFNTLRRLWMEHVLWTRFFLISTIGNLNDLDAVTKRLLRNPADFAAVLKLFYGNQKAKNFETLFTDHLLIAAELVKAAMANDAANVEEQRKKWYANADQIVNFLGNVNPYWSNKTWQALLYDHLRMTENEAVQILTGQYEESIAEFDAIQEEALKMADEMACGIIQQFKI